MKTFSYLDAQKNLVSILALAQSEDVQIEDENGNLYLLFSQPNPEVSPLDVPGIDTKATTEDILQAVRRSRVA